MKFDFDKLTDRRGTHSLKWDVGEGELPMWVADMDFETAPAVKAAIEARAKEGIFGYATVPDEFFLAVAKWWKTRHGVGFLPENMVYSNGIVAAISSAVRKFTTPAESVLIQPPVYNIFYNSILNNGRNILTSDLVYEGGEYRVDFSDLEEKLSRPQTSMMILCNPHNPVGKIWSREELARVGELCHRYGVTVISDEIHCDIVEPGREYTPFAAVNDCCADISISCISASKTFNLAGLQSACLVAKNPILRHKIWRAVNTDEVGEPNIFAMNANIAAFGECGEWCDALNEYIAENKRVAREYIAERIPNLFVPPSEATYLLWVDISRYSTDSVDFCRKLRAHTGLYLSDGAEYGGNGASFVRINLATQRQRVLDGLSRLERFCSENF
ncbi:MAG: pyridoxal phosphate-dependent aminotransferase [Clostridia bacterium]|nr:pyridoxal phosphate-dependent aminotransferase [Clostridia bacterium]